VLPLQPNPLKSTPGLLSIPPYSAYSFTPHMLPIMYTCGGNCPSLPHFSGEAGPSLRHIAPNRVMLRPGIDGRLY
jgi:hypothetical protein